MPSFSRGRSRSPSPSACAAHSLLRAHGPGLRGRGRHDSREHLQIVEQAPGRPVAAPTARKKVLFVGEATTLANVARPLALASALDPDAYEVSFACDPRFERLYPDLPFPTRAIDSISSEQFLRALATSSPIYDAETLRRYVREDLKVIGEMSPDAVVGCFRLSLAVSARLAGVPYLAITNACWSPYRSEPLPFMNPVLKSVGPNGLLTAVRPLALAYHSLPFNKVCRESGLPSVGLDVRRVFTEADHALYSDVTELPGCRPSDEPPLPGTDRVVARGRATSVVERAAQGQA